MRRVSHAKQPVVEFQARGAARGRALVLPVRGAAEGQQGALGIWSAVVGEGQRVRLAGPRLCRGLGTMEGV